MSKYPSKHLLDDRAAWARERFIIQPRCMLSGRLLRSGFPTRYEIHEIAPRSRSPRTWAHRCNYLLLSSHSHGRIHDGKVDIATQLASKAICDPEHFDLDEWLSLLPDKGPDYVTIEEVVAAADNLKDLRALFSDRHFDWVEKT